jgi:hypothetical protein
VNIGNQSDVEKPKSGRLFDYILETKGENKYGRNMEQKRTGKKQATKKERKT